METEHRACGALPNLIRRGSVKAAGACPCCAPEEVAPANGDRHLQHGQNTTVRLLDARVAHTRAPGISAALHLAIRA